MHIPDGFLSPPVWAALDIAAAPAVALIARKARTGLDESRIPLLGVLGAFVFAAQMVNFPVGPGTSGHLVGGALLAYTLGPATASVVMTAILAIQALVFQDGGLLALGANVWNMAIIGVFVGYLPVYLARSGKRRSTIVFAGAALSVLASACFALSELLLSGVKMPRGVVAVSLTLFAISATIEALITVAVVRSIDRLHPAWIRRPHGSRSPAFAMLSSVVVALASVGVVFASAAPDGLQKMAEQVGIASRATTTAIAPLKGYEIPAFGSVFWSRIGAGLIGVALIYAIGLLIARRISRMRADSARGSV
jgi:cobalt/nickel transport system permease protein